MGKALRALAGGLSEALAPETAELSERHLRIRTQSVIKDIFRHLYLGHMGYRNGKIVVIRQPSTPEDRRSLERCMKIAERAIEKVGFLLPCTWEDWQVTKEALEAGLFIPEGNEHGMWGLCRTDGQYIYDAQWNSVQAGKVAIESACGWEGKPLPADAGQCLEVLSKYLPFTKLGDMDGAL